MLENPPLAQYTPTLGGKEVAAEADKANIDSAIKRNILICIEPVSCEGESEVGNAYAREQQRHVVTCKFQLFRRSDQVLSQ